MTIQEAENALTEARRQYADQMDHLSKYARGDSDQVRAGVFPDALAGAVLQRALSTYHLCVAADKALKRARMGR